MYLVLRSYGGLGNQFFQYFFCLNFQEKIKFKEIYSIHSTNYSHQFTHEEFLKIYPKPSKIIKLISDLRLPMILLRLGISKKGYIRLGNFIFLDSYFQNKSFYSCFSKADIKKSLENIRSILDVSDKNAKFENVYHLRLKDFFDNEDEEINYLKISLNKMIPNSHIITNRQDLFESKEVKKLMKMKKLSLVDTEGFDGKEIVEKFSVYSNITTNNSTLAFCAAILYKRNIFLSPPDDSHKMKSALDYSNLVGFQEMVSDQ